MAALAGQLGKQAPGPIGGALGLLAGLILFGLIALATVGVAGLVNLLNQRMGDPAASLGRTLRAGLLLVLAALTPFVGWFVFTPVALLVALGAAIQAVLGRPHPATGASSAPAHEPA